VIDDSDEGSDDHDVSATAAEPDMENNEQTDQATDDMRAASASASEMAEPNGDNPASVENNDGDDSQAERWSQLMKRCKKLYKSGRFAESYSCGNEDLLWSQTISRITATGWLALSSGRQFS